MQTALARACRHAAESLRQQRQKSRGDGFSGAFAPGMVRELA